MKILVVGSGGREHALAWKLKQSPRVKELFVAPGNAGTQTIARNVPIKASETEKLAEFSSEQGIDLVVIGPDNALADGIVNLFRKKNIPVFGPTKEAAQLESSKSFARKLMKKYGIPSPEFAVFSDSNVQDAIDYAKQSEKPLVVKADGLALGKGVIVPNSVEETVAGIKLMLEQKAFGASGSTILLEEKMSGIEASYFAVSDGKNVVPLLSAQDHKRVFDNDKGPNCYSSDTEILTNQGWKTFDALDKNMTVCIYDSVRNEIRFELPQEIHWMKYSGKMIHFKHRAIDLLVTPNHKMLVQQRKNLKRIKVKRADAIKSECFIFQTAKWNGKNWKYYPISELDYKFNRKLEKLQIPFLDWVRFLGLYISEGHYSNRKNEHRVFISQTQSSKHLFEMEKIVAKLPFKYSYLPKENEFRINSIQLAQELAPLGDCYSKYVPDYIKESSTEVIQEFLRCFNMGGGDIHYGRVRFCSSSKRLIDDIQELILKCNCTSIISRDKRTTMVNPINKKIYKASPIYSIEMKPRTKSSIRRKDRKIVDYAGFVGCVSVSTCFVVVRRNHRVAISGNTGGMGSFAPSPLVNKEMEEKILEKIIQPTIRGMRSEGIPFEGCLYAGLMIQNNEPRIVEFNARFGDPETQAIMPLMESDLLDLFENAVQKRVPDSELEWKNDSANCVVLASKGYPEKPETGFAIEGLEKAEAMKNSVLFHAGTTQKENSIVTSGGRVLNCVGTGKNLQEAIQQSYQIAQQIRFEGVHFRKDIGKKGLLL